MYGITKTDKKILKIKLENQQKYLNNNFLMVNGLSIPYSDFYFSSWHNSQRYIAELNNRVSSLNKFANKQGLKPIFAVLTLPSEYHRKKIIKLKSGKEKLVFNKKFINDENHTIKAGSDKLQMVVRSIMNSKYFRNIPKDKRCYITTKEPHLDGTCHLNLLVFVPIEYFENCVFAIKSRFLDTHSKITTDIKNPTAYVMKYIFKTLDDLRDNCELENLTDITFWYLKYNIRRFTMSKTFISLEVYRKLNGTIDLISLTKNYNKGLITVLLDPQTKKPVQIFDEFGELWQKIRFRQIRNSISSSKPTIRDKKHKNYPFIDIKYLKKLFSNLATIDKSFALMRDFELIDYYKILKDTKTFSIENLQFIANFENELFKRGYSFITGKNELHNLNDITKIKDDLHNRSIL